MVGQINMRLLCYPWVPPTRAGIVLREDAMRLAYVLFLFLAAFSMPAAAADADQNKRDVEKVGSAYAESFAKQDAAGIAALYATGGMLVTPTGPHTEIAKYSEGGFKAGFNRNDITVNQVWSLGDNVLAVGDYHLTGKGQGGTPIEEMGAWSSVYVREGGVLKIHMLSAMPKPPQAPK